MDAQDHKQALPPGFRLGPYRVVGVLGVGGFGVTYLCEHAGLGVQVAVKEYLPNEIAVRDGAEVHPKSAGDREGFEWGLSRFLDEARTLARFEHPNVVRVRDCFEANNTAYIVMDYEDGEPLDALLRRHGTLTEAQLKRVLLPVVDGLRQVHGAGFLHRDIKPANVFVRRSDESPVLLDFGSARQALGRRSRSVTAIASAGYSPPEQYESDGAHGAWTDIYALSALCYRAITGDVPMEATQRQSQLLRTQTDPLPKLAEAPAVGYSPAFLDAVDWGLHLIETERPQSLDEWLPGLASSEAVDTSTAASRPERRETERPQRITRVATLIGGAVAAIGLALYFLLANGPQDSQPDQVPPPASKPPTTQPPSVGEAHEVSKESGPAATTNVVPDETMSNPSDDPLQVRAMQGDAEAQYKLGRIYDQGKDVPEDDARAASWYRKAAEQGVANAQIALSNLYYAGEGVPKDASQALFWYRRAAEQEDASAQIALGMGNLYYAGEGVPKDASQAAIWYRRAAEQGDASAQTALGSLYYAGEGEDDVQAVSWLRKAAEQGNAEAQTILGSMYADGRGVPEDDVQAVSWLRKAAEQGNAVAQNNLGFMHANGEGVPKDANQAVIWHRRAAEQGDAGAQYNLGFMYAYGEGVPEDDVQAYAWFNLAAAQGLEKGEQAKATLRQEMTQAQIAEAQRLSRELAD